MDSCTVKGPKEKLWDKIKAYVGNSEGEMFTVGKSTLLGDSILDLAGQVGKLIPGAVEIDEEKICIRHKLLTD